MTNRLRAMRPRGRRRGPRRPGWPTLRTKARRASGNEWFAVFEHGLGDPRGVR
jgi:hypothetical protein